MKKPILLCLLAVLLAAPAYSADILDVKAEYVKGVQYLANGDLANAESQFKAVLKYDSFTAAEDNETLKRYKAKSYYFLGDIAFMQKKYKDAVDNYQIVVRSYSSQDIYARTLYKLGRALVLNSEYASGTAILYDYLGKYENTDDLADNALYWVARAYTGQKNYRLAIDALELILTDYPSTPLAYDIRSSLTELRSLLSAEESLLATAQNAQSILDEYQLLVSENEKLQQEKAMLESISDLLYIKQRLLEIKAEKIELLTEIREQREGK